MSSPRIQQLNEASRILLELSTHDDPPLFRAIALKNIEAVRQLLDNGADPLATSRQGRTPVQLCDQNDSKDRQIAILLVFKIAATVKPDAMEVVMRSLYEHKMGYSLLAMLTLAFELNDSDQYHVLFDAYKLAYSKICNWPHKRLGLMSKVDTL